HLVVLGAVRREPARLIIRQRVSVIQGAGVQPHAIGIPRPRITHRARQQVPPESSTNRVWGEPEVGYFDRSVIHFAQLVPATESFVFRGEMKGDRRLLEMRANLRV